MLANIVPARLQVEALENTACTIIKPVTWNAFCKIARLRGNASTFSLIFVHVVVFVWLGELDDVALCDVLELIAVDALEDTRN